MSTKHSVKSRRNLRIALGSAFVLMAAVVVAAIFMTGKPTTSFKQPNEVVVGSSIGVVVQSQLPQPPVEKAPVKLDGTWTAENNGVHFVAVVSDQQIAINLINNGTTMLYWVGSFNTELLSGDKINSVKIDVNKAVLSGADSKIFTVNDNSIGFEFKIMGQTHNVLLARS